MTKMPSVSATETMGCSLLLPPSTARELLSQIAENGGEAARPHPSLVACWMPGWQGRPMSEYTRFLEGSHRDFSRLRHPLRDCTSMWCC